MIKVIGKKTEEPKVYRTVCFECEATLEYEESDTYIGALGGRELICPSCGEKIFVDEPEGIDLNSSNIEFPKHFFAPSDRAKDIDNATIQQWVKERLHMAESDTENYGHYLTGSGNTIVFVVKYEDEYSVYVTNKYWECSIPRE
jgi:DNA-directed RNA polymerase subunit RPC12/RpoP